MTITHTYEQVDMHHKIWSCSPVQIQNLGIHFTPMMAEHTFLNDQKFPPKEFATYTLSEGMEINCSGCR